MPLATVCDVSLARQYNDASIAYANLVTVANAYVSTSEDALHESSHVIDVLRDGTTGPRWTHADNYIGTTHTFADMTPGVSVPSFVIARPALLQTTLDAAQHIDCSAIAAEACVSAWQQEYSRVQVAYSRLHTSVAEYSGRVVSALQGPRKCTMCLRAPSRRPLERESTILAASAGSTWERACWRRRQWTCGSKRPMSTIPSKTIGSRHGRGDWWRRASALRPYALLLWTRRASHRRRPRGHRRRQRLRHRHHRCHPRRRHLLRSRLRPRGCHWRRRRRRPYRRRRPTALHFDMAF